MRWKRLWMLMGAALVAILAYCLLSIYNSERKPHAAIREQVKPNSSADTPSTLLKSLHKSFADGADEETLSMVKDNPRLVIDVDESECTALHYAARYGRLETAKWLIEQKADVNTIAYNKFSPMHMVKDGAVARLLIEAGADLKAKDSWSKTPLQKAAEEDRKDVCEAILGSGFPIDLATALRLGKRDLVKTMIKENPAIAKDAEGGSDLWRNTTPLGVAASKGDKEIVDLLVKAGAPVNAVTERPNWGPITALCNAVWANQYEIAEILCEAGADCNMSGGRLYPRLLDYALEHSDPKMVDLLVRHGAKPSEKK